MQPWFVRENKWRAARYGMDAIIIQNAAGHSPENRPGAERVLSNSREGGQNREREGKDNDECSDHLYTPSFPAYTNQSKNALPVSGTPHDVAYSAYMHPTNPPATFVLRNSAGTSSLTGCHRS